MRERCAGARRYLAAADAAASAHQSWLVASRTAWIRASGQRTALHSIVAWDAAKLPCPDMPGVLTFVAARSENDPDC